MCRKCAKCLAPFRRIFFTAAVLYTFRSSGAMENHLRETRFSLPSTPVPCPVDDIATCLLKRTHSGFDLAQRGRHVPQMREMFIAVPPHFFYGGGSIHISLLRSYGKPAAGNPLFASLHVRPLPRR